MLSKWCPYINNHTHTHTERAMAMIKSVICVFLHHTALFTFNYTPFNTPLQTSIITAFHSNTYMQSLSFLSVSLIMCVFMWLPGVAISQLHMSIDETAEVSPELPACLSHTDTFRRWIAQKRQLYSLFMCKNINTWPPTCTRQRHLPYVSTGAEKSCLILPKTSEVRSTACKGVSRQLRS